MNALLIAALTMAAVLQASGIALAQSDTGASTGNKNTTDSISGINGNAPSPSTLPRQPGQVSGASTGNTNTTDSIGGIGTRPPSVGRAPN